METATNSSFGTCMFMRYVFKTAIYRRPERGQPGAINPSWNLKKMTAYATFCKINQNRRIMYP